jgi:hypothetical protein
VLGAVGVDVGEDFVGVVVGVDDRVDVVGFCVGA